MYQELSLCLIGEAGGGKEGWEGTKKIPDRDFKVSMRFGAFPPCIFAVFSCVLKKWHDGIYAPTAQHVTQQRAPIFLRPIKV